MSSAGTQPGSSRPRAVSKHEKAGLKMPVAKMAVMMKKRQPAKKQVGTAAAIYAAAVVEYAMAEVFELGVERMKERKGDAKMLMNADLLEAVRGDEELAALWAGVRIQAGDKLKNVRWGLLCPWDKQEELKKRAAQKAAREEENARKEGMPVSRFRQIRAEKAEARAAGVKKIVKPKAKA